MLFFCIDINESKIKRINEFEIIKDIIPQNLHKYTIYSIPNFHLENRFRINKNIRNKYAENIIKMVNFYFSLAENRYLDRQEALTIVLTKLNDSKKYIDHSIEYFNHYQYVTTSTKHKLYLISQVLTDIIKLITPNI